MFSRNKNQPKNRIEVLSYWGNYTLDDGTILRNWSIVVVGRKYLAVFEHNRFIVNPLVNMAIFRDYESKRGIPEIWSIYDIAKEQENKVNLQNDAQALNLNPPAYAPQGFFVKNEIKLAPGKQIEYKPGIDEPSALIKMQFPLISYWRNATGIWLKPPAGSMRRPNGLKAWGFLSGILRKRPKNVA